MSLAQYFDSVWREGEDPFGYRHRWYEARKRDLLLATLTRPTYDRAWEIGCANGELTRALAPRCASLLATDLHPRAVAVARQACADRAHVRIERMEHPRQWPAGVFDLVVVGEMGYYLDDAALDAFADRLAASLTPGALLLACHWRHDFEGRGSPADAVHARLGAIAGLAPVLRYADADFVLEGWSGDFVSPAQREGLR
ncbi:SAM-dependent methyltransferase [Luteimonas kalidii]|uniref:SAM-dependent methyltransferase n=1 Tax=Luteimonas kalidii TaxID=3042025 RepID=A0ABT6JUH1_9GAMM|nr:SAM-dependent methyltransferase [Luteimonas kalidii]MDH5834335.1 SAM-dependent methyltransferase [Luteimonas kalidii]